MSVGKIAKMFIFNVAWAHRALHSLQILQLNSVAMVLPRGKVLLHNLGQDVWANVDRTVIVASSVGMADDKHLLEDFCRLEPCRCIEGHPIFSALKTSSASSCVCGDTFLSACEEYGAQERLCPVLQSSLPHGANIDPTIEVIFKCALTAARDFTPSP